MSAFPVEIGLVQSLSRPGANVTGVSFYGDSFVKPFMVARVAMSVQLSARAEQSI
jgi:hypothetical protein